MTGILILKQPKKETDIQFYLQRQQNTTLQNIRVQEIIVDILSKKAYTGMFLLYIEKAFDRV